MTGSFNRSNLESNFRDLSKGTKTKATAEGNGIISEQRQQFIELQRERDIQREMKKKFGEKKSTMTGPAIKKRTDQDPDDPEISPDIKQKRLPLSKGSSKISQNFYLKNLINKQQSVEMANEYTNSRTQSNFRDQPQQKYSVGQRTESAVSATIAGI